MTALLIAVLTASLMGSLHCAGMCGPLAIALLPRGGKIGQRVSIQASWHGGRLVVYALLGLLFGAAGAALDLGLAALTIQGAVMRISGLIIVGVGIAAILRRFGVRWGSHRPQSSSFMGAIVRRAHGLTPIKRALMLGGGSALLPCGWLYAFALAAAGSGGAIQGALLMATFWVGTVPALALAGEGGAQLIRPFAKRAPWMPDVAVIAVGLLLLFERNPLPHRSPDSPDSPAIAGTAPILTSDGSLNDLRLPTTTTAETIGELDSGNAACCNDRSIGGP